MHATQNTRKRRIYLTISTSVVLGMLAFFKYWAFLVGNINYVLKTQFPLWEIALPLGISFYTFQALTYVIDVYRHEVRVQSLFKVSFIHFHVPSACGRTYCNRAYSHVAEQIDRREKSENNRMDFYILCCIDMGWVIFHYTDTASLTYMFKVLFGFSDEPVNDFVYQPDY